MHHPLIYDSDKQKLSKRFGSDAIHVWKSEGRSKESILAKLFKKMNPDISAKRVNLEEFLKNLVL